MSSFDLNPNLKNTPAADPKPRLDLGAGLEGASSAASAGGTAGSRPQLHVDSDWKAQAQAEKERLARQEQERTKDRRGPAGPDELPPADFRALVDILASQALGGLGAYGDSKTGRVIVDLAGARFGIDLLAVLEEKTKGNLAPEEAQELKEILAGLRSRYVHFHDLVTRQQAAMAAGGGPAGPMGAPPPAARPPAGGPTLHVP